MTARTQVSTGLMVLSILLVGVAGCAQVGTPAVEQVTPTLLSTPSPAAPAEATLPAGWETYTNPGQCGYAIDHPSDMDGASQNTYNWLLNPTTTEPSGPVPSFVFISVIPDGFQNEPGAIYNYDPLEMETLLNMQVGESKSLREDPNVAPSFTYTRLPDTTLSDQAAQTYENTQPWEFPAGTKEIRYYLKANGCTYLIGGYVVPADPGQPGAIDEELFGQIIASFRLAR